MQIRKINKHEIESLIELARVTFKETFSDSNNIQDLEKYINESFNESRLMAEFNNKDSFFYFGEIDNNHAGYLKLNKGTAQKESFHPGWQEIERIYILEQYQKQGLGSFLINFAFLQAENSGCEYVWLGVWEHNHSAISFYSKIGFKKFGSHTFTVGSDPQTDILMKMSTKQYFLTGSKKIKA